MAEVNMDEQFHFGPVLTIGGQSPHHQIQLSLYKFSKPDTYNGNQEGREG